MMKIYQAQLKNFKRLLVEANGYGDAANKIERYLEFTSDTSDMFDKDGNIVPDDESGSEINDIRLIADFIIK